MTKHSEDRKAALGAMVTAFALIATHVVSRATRDALFLSAYDVSNLPWMLIGSAAVSAISVVLTARGLRRLGPAKMLRGGCLASALLFVIEALLINRFERILPVVAFLHITSVGALLISAFWSQINERFDPRKGRKVVARVEAAAALGAVVGGICAERLASATSASVLLFFSAGLCGLAFAASLATPGGGTRVDAPIENTVSTKEIINNGYVQSLAAIVVLIALSSTLLDYAFKAAATQATSSETSLTRLFAIYYAVVGVLTFLIQTFVAPWMLKAAGPAGTAAALPASVSTVGCAAILFPGFWSVALIRGIEAVLQNSFYRSGYELMFIPIDPALKRKAKAALDVGMDKLGDAAGAGLVLLLAVLLPGPEATLYVALAVIASCLAVYVIYVIRAKYIDALGASLMVTDDVAARGTRVSATRKDITSMADSRPSELTPRGALAHGATTNAPDSELRKAIDLRKENAPDEPNHGEFDRAFAAEVLSLLEDDELRPRAESYLRTHVEECIGLLTDALLDQRYPAKLRRRIPRILRGADGQRAVAGLLSALDDPDFEVRFRSAIALSALIEANADVAVPPRVAFAKAKEALDDHDRVWDQVIHVEDDEIHASMLGTDGREHYNKSLQHVFEVLGLCLQRDVLRRALRALWSGDEAQRGTALEYLGEVLPEDLRSQLWPKLKVADRLPPPHEEGGVRSGSLPSRPDSGG